jgi:2-polyprenyl-3-methyl-5-hydroxy-6-metoxy-1,4-benzoquinol methylase
MTRAVTSGSAPWVLGELQPGHEWFAFTFREQDSFRMSKEDWQSLLLHNDAFIRSAYDGMRRQQPWARHADAEARSAIDAFGIRPPATVLDFGCGEGRHALSVARQGFHVTGVDVSESMLEVAEEAAIEEGLSDRLVFVVGDCRRIDLGARFDAALCLYDVIGSSPDNEDNAAILTNLARHLNTEGRVLLSVMNMQLTEDLAKYRGSVRTEPEQLLKLPASTIMENTGNVFDPEYYLLDEAAGVVYRKEQFTGGPALPAELIVIMGIEDMSATSW